MPPENMAAFCDGNVPWTPQKDLLKNRVYTLSNLGYDIFMVNYEVEELSGKKATKKKGLPPVELKSPDAIKLNEEDLAEIKEKCGRCPQQLTRFTANLKDAAQTHKMQTSPELAQFDIRAVIPHNEKTLMQACSHLDVDIVSLDLTQKLPFYLKRPTIHMALERGVHFEIKYCPAIRDESFRRNIIANAISLVEVCKGKNIIISSDCEKPIELRSPQDVANLGLLFGFTDSQAKDAISTNYRKLLLKSKSRQTASCALSLTKAVDMPASDSWKVEQQRAEDEPENEGEESEEDSSDEDSEAEAEMVVSRSTVDDKDGVAKGNDQSTERPASLKREKSTDSETVSPRKKQKRENAASGT